MGRNIAVYSAGNLRGVRRYPQRDSVGGCVDRNYNGADSARARCDRRRSMDVRAVVGHPRSCFLAAQLYYRRESGIRGRLGSRYDWSVYGIAELFPDPAGGAGSRVGSSAYSVGNRESDGRSGDSFCTVFIVGNGGCDMFLRKKAGGYMTVEASFIITWTIFLFVFLIYLSFYSYDKCVLFQDAYAVCFRGSIQKQEDNIVPYISAHMKEQFGEKYFGTGEVHGSVDRKGDVTDVTGECQVKVPIRAAFTMYDATGWKIRTRARAQIINPTHIIRKSRWIGNVLENVK